MAAKEHGGLLSSGHSRVETIEKGTQREATGEDSPALASEVHSSAKFCCRPPVRERERELERAREKPEVLLAAAAAIHCCQFFCALRCVGVVVVFFSRSGRNLRESFVGEWS